jgi:hypothetical protein
MSLNRTPPVQPGSRLALQVDENGLTVYANKAGLISLAERLLRIAQASPDECFECHTRMELADTFGHGDRGDVSLIVDDEIAGYFLQLPPDAPADAQPVGFELTFMHVNEPALAGLKKLALQGQA